MGIKKEITRVTRVTKGSSEVLRSWAAGSLLWYWHLLPIHGVVLKGQNRDWRGESFGCSTNHQLLVKQKSEQGFLSKSGQEIKDTSYIQ